MDVEAYVKEDENSGDVILSMVKDNSETFTIDAEDIKKVSPDYKKLYYWDEKGKERSVSISALAPIIYNGQPIENITENTFYPEDGEIRLIKKA